VSAQFDSDEIRAGMVARLRAQGRVVRVEAAGGGELLQFGEELGGFAKFGFRRCDLGGQRACCRKQPKG
jgi:hypothetical protein